MADAETARTAREATIGDECHFVAHALSVKRSGGGKHFAHAGAALWPFIANDEYIAFLEFLFVHGFEAGFFRVEAARRPFEYKVFHARYFYNCAFGCEVAFEHHHATFITQRFVVR